MTMIMRKKMKKRKSESEKPVPEARLNKWCLSQIHAKRCLKIVEKV